MQAVAVILLLAVLAVATACFAVLSASQARRARVLARAAHEAGLQFSPEDLFDVPRRYADLILIHCGHSPQAENVAHGRLHGLPIRAFDFRYEVGHGTRRVTRHYSVVAAETERELPSALVWRGEDEAFLPLAAGRPVEPIDGWHFLGDAEFSRRLARACSSLVGECLTAQTQGGRALLCVPVTRQARDRALPIAQAAAVLGEICAPARPAG